jgi:uncharacterized Zn finger protein (UPF0148 family)
MKAEKYDRAIAMICPTCGNTQFQYDEGSGPLRCVSCDRVFERDELIRENGEIIEAHAAEMSYEVLRDATKEMQESLRKAFKCSKHITFK